MNVHDFIAAGGWVPPDPQDRVRSLTDIRDFVVVLSDYGVWLIRDTRYDPEQKFEVLLVHSL